MARAGDRSVDVVVRDQRLAAACPQRLVGPLAPTDPLA
jgi:hypothetical protein